MQHSPQHCCLQVIRLMRQNIMFNVHQKKRTEDARPILIHAGQQMPIHKTMQYPMAMTNPLRAVSILRIAGRRAGTSHKSIPVTRKPAVTGSFDLNPVELVAPKQVRS